MFHAKGYTNDGPVSDMEKKAQTQSEMTACLLCRIPRAISVSLLQMHYGQHKVTSGRVIFNYICFDTIISGYFARNWLGELLCVDKNLGFMGRTKDLVFSDLMV